MAVLWLTFMTSQTPYISLALALSFGIYGLLKKKVSVSSTGSVAAETLVMVPLALGYLIYLEAGGQGTFFNQGPLHPLLLISAGLVTALPLRCFAQGAKHLPLATIGMLQYITPTMQMLWALFVTQEHMPPERWVGFIIIWVAVVVYLIDLLRHRPRRARRTTGRPADE